MAKQSRKKRATTRSTRRPPWKRSNPRSKAARKRLSAGQKASAKRAASRAGRPYPNLVDNMRVAAAGRRRPRRNKRRHKRQG
jgi:hypothetical protein